MNVLALEPWYGGSHRQFLDGLAGQSRHSWQLLTLPNVNWRWRMEMGAVALANQAAELAQKGFHPDVFFASSMLNLSAFLSLCRRFWPDVPSVYYLHENQLTYPLPEGRERARSYWQINMLSAMAADLVVFNSAFHRDNFLASLEEELQKYPDFLPERAPSAIRKKSTVLHIGLDLKKPVSDPLAATLDTDTGGSQVILRNQRWDYDKNPAGFLELILRLKRRQCNFQLILTGKGVDRIFAQSSEWRSIEDHILFRGFVEDRAEYFSLLDKADIVVSTALHEFFGIAVMEAISRGCHPLLPHRLSYPEVIPERLHRPLLHAPVLYDDFDELTVLLTSILKGEERRLPTRTLVELAQSYSWDHLIDVYDSTLQTVAVQHVQA